ncbi:hypothetical protein LCGC14_2890700 [marine sediment metagenome]|uniref:Uncharacterized protein n=1 Tax=marine sediment metagenome TaxID=412755 RepID=A0A0F8XXL5_9ZZZZ
MERSEEEKVGQLGIIVKLGGAEYKVAPLVIRDARNWRLKVANVLCDLSVQPPETRRWFRFIGWLVGLKGKKQNTRGFTNATTDDPEAFDKALKYLLVTMQDTVIDLFFEYAKDLNRKEIEAIATEEQIGEAFSRIVEVGFPLAQSHSMLKQRLLQ